MSSPPHILAGLDLIPHVDTPSSSNQTSRSSSPDHIMISHHRSKTAPPPLSSSNLVAQPLASSIPPSLDSSPEQPASATFSSLNTSHSESTPIQPSALRRTSSTLSHSSNGKDRKKLRFTPLTAAVAGPSGTSHEGDVFFPGHDLNSVEEGRGRGHKGIPKDQADYLRSDPGTPNLLETADQIRRTLSLASLDALLVLSSNPSGERDRFIAEVSKAGRDLVWRDKDEKRLLPKDTERASVLAFKRGLRSFLLAFSVRAGVNVLLMLFRTMRRKKLRLALLGHAIFGPEPFRFGAMIGTFTFLNTLTLHLLRLAPPLSYFRRRLKTGLFIRPTFGPPEREGDEGERRWQAAVAGAVGSLGLLWESRSRRTGVAQQMFVRGLQGTYNHYTPRFGIHIPHGDLLLFGACCGQIMFAFLLSPETMPREYSSWIQSASRVPEFAVLANRSAVRQGIIEPAQIQRALGHKDLIGANKVVLENLLTKVQNGWKPHGFVPCELVHPWSSSCIDTNFRRFFSVFRLMLPVYSALHIIPMLVLRRHAVKNHPLRMIARAIWGITRSCSFLGVFVAIYQTLFCARIQLLGNNRINGWMADLLRRKETFWFMGFSTCLSLLVEEKKRRAELAMYVLPRALESVWSSARKRAWVPLVPFGETILGAAAMAMVMDAYKHQPDALSGIVRRLLYQLVGPV
ncbi:hypothetical protein BCR39DRAFT_547390 [Naematelia encephala]|uniref:Transmembrane protein 135 N-terminal domain-containing protein n=1 Tax=Naematelia encephala TaxID=71784 RepID=A0A1Y2ANY7_9TREE|nr:hypothetical protein BCR39DRAFT_547390 [Naematelia encephala]